MATSGIIYGSASQNPTVYRPRIYWYRKNVNAVTKQSTIVATMQLERMKRGWEFENWCSDNKININWQASTIPSFYLYAYDADWDRNGSILSLQQVEFTATHENNGSLTVNLGGEFSTGTLWFVPGICTVPNTNISVDSIDVSGPTVTNLRTTNIDKTTVTYAVNISGETDWGQYRLNGGAWIDDGNSKTISGLIPNTTYTLQTRYRKKSNQVWGNSNTITFKTLANDVTPPVFVSANTKTVDNHTIYAFSTFTASTGVKEIKVSVNNGASYPNNQGNITNLESNTTYQVKFRATANNGVTATSPTYNVKTAEDPVDVQKIIGSWKQGIISIT